MNFKRTSWILATMIGFMAGCGKDGKKPEPGTDPAGNSAPVITSFAPAKGMPGGEVIIQGKNFKDNISQNTVIFKDMPHVGVIVEAKTTQLTVRIPQDAPTGKIIVKVGTQSDTSDTDFVIDPDLIAVTAFSPASGPIGTPVTLTGINFGLNTKIKFNGIECTITDRQPASLTFTIPFNTALTKHKIEVISGANTIHTQTEFTVTANGPTARWEDKGTTMANEGVNIYPGGVSFVFNNKIYWGFNAFLTGEPTASYVIYDPAQPAQGWASPATPPLNMAPANLQRATAVVHNGRVFFGTGFTTVASNKWWEYDPATNTSTALADYPNAVGNAISFVLNGKIYVGFGGTNRNLYQFNLPGSGDPGSWTLKATGTFQELNSGSALVLGNEVILGRALPALNQPRNAIFNFKEPDQLTRLTDMPQDLPSMATPSFTLGNKGYFVINKNVWEYTPDAAGGTWRVALGGDQQPAIKQAAVLNINGTSTAFGWTAAGHLYEFKF